MKDFKRIVKTKLRAAIRRLSDEPPSDRAIHDARKDIKTARGLMRLVGRSRNADTARDIQGLRRAARLLSSLRDAEAVVASAKALCLAEHGVEGDAPCASVLDVLERRKARVIRDAGRTHVRERSVRALERVLQSSEDWPREHGHLRVLTAEIARRYRKGRQAIELAQRRGSADDFHKWRKQVQALGYALHLMDRGDPAVRGRYAELKRLDGWLGEDRDLLMVRRRALSSPGLRRNHAARRWLQLRTDYRRDELRGMALSLGGRLFKDTTRTFERRLRHSWRLSC